MNDYLNPALDALDVQQDEYNENSRNDKYDNREQGVPSHFSDGSLVQWGMTEKAIRDKEDRLQEVREEVAVGHYQDSVI